MPDDPTVKELEELLGRKNGFYAFESALHLLPSNCENAPMDIERWNNGGLWREEYDGVADGFLFFAEDAFGEQFALRDGMVYRFDGENGAAEEMANSLEDWASLILDGYEYETGYPLAHEWQMLNGTLMPGERLLPKVPFVIGGAYKIENLYAGDPVERMRLRAFIWKQIKDLPDESKVRLTVAKKNR